MWDIGRIADQQGTMICGWDKTVSLFVHLSPAMMGSTLQSLLSSRLKLALE
jgi:hypothetical protein